MIVVDKPAGLLSVPGRLDEHKDSLLSRLQAEIPDALAVHRLDMVTSGLMVFARGKDVHRSLSKAFEARTISKGYTADVWGEVKGEIGLIDLPLITDWPNRPRQKVDHDIGKPSQTEWRVARRAAEFTRVHLTPITGRSHQLRVHMAECGHPILGDPFYGHNDSQKARGRLALHASRLGLDHPLSQEPLTFESEAPF